MLKQFSVLLRSDDLTDSNQSFFLFCFQAVSKSEEAKGDDGKTEKDPEDPDQKPDQPDNPIEIENPAEIPVSQNTPNTSASPPAVTVAQDRERSKEDEQEVSPRFRLIRVKILVWENY